MAALYGVAALPPFRRACCALHRISAPMPGEILGSANTVSLGKGRWRVIPVPRGLVGTQVNGHLSRRPIVAGGEADTFRGQPIDDLCRSKLLVRHRPFIASSRRRSALRS